MNYIQRSWLKVLKPVTTLVNDKIAKKTGMLGRIGRFFSFGPRQFGYHTSNKALAFLNHIIVSHMSFLLHRHSFMRSLTMNGFSFLRVGGIVTYLGTAAFFYWAFLTIAPDDIAVEEGTSLEFLKNNIGNAMPINALQNRKSAHYTEINSYYSHEMAIELLKKTKQISDERKRQSEKTKKLKFARPGYNYIEAHSNALQN